MIPSPRMRIDESYATCPRGTLPSPRFIRAWLCLNVKHFFTTTCCGIKLSCISSSRLGTGGAHIGLDYNKWVMITSSIVSILRSTGERPQQKELGEGVVWDNRKLRKLSNVSITCRGYILKKNLSATDDFSVPHLAFTDKFKNSRQKRTLFEYKCI